MNDTERLIKNLKIESTRIDKCFIVTDELKFDKVNQIDFEN